MMKPQFTPEETRLLYRYRSRRAGDAWGWMLVLAALAAFAIYGVWRRDIVAVFIGWAGTFAWMLWWIAASMRAGGALRNILEKHERALACEDATTGHDESQSR